MLQLIVPVLQDSRVLFISSAFLHIQFMYHSATVTSNKVLQVLTILDNERMTLKLTTDVSFK